MKKISKTFFLENCPLCECTSFHHYSSGFDYEYQSSSNRWNFVQCDRCAHIWLNPRPSCEDLHTIYPENYYSYLMDKTLNKFIYSCKSWLDKHKILRIVSSMNIIPAIYLDLGCGDGRYLQVMKNNFDVQCLGAEINPQLVNRLNSRGLKCFEVHQDFQVIHDYLETSMIDLITAFHVIEHVPDPLSYIRQANRLLSLNGFIAVETPNYDSLDCKLFRNSFWGGYHFPRHWHLFKEKTLVDLFTKAGFAVISVQYSTGHSFWLFSFHHIIKYKFKLPRIASLFDPMRSKVFLPIFTIFDMLRIKFGCKTSSLIIVAKKISEIHV